MSQEKIYHDFNLRQEFRNQTDCYADTHHYSDDTIPPIKVEGDVVPAMTETSVVSLAERFASHKCATRDKLIAKQQEYIDLLGKEIDSMTAIASIHHWKSDNVQKGTKLREEIETLKQQL